MYQFSEMKGLTRTVIGVLWILSSFLGNGSSVLAPGDARLTAEMGLADAILTIPVTLILIWIMLQITRAQDVTRHAEVFA